VSKGLIHSNYNDNDSYLFSVTVLLTLCMLLYVHIRALTVCSHFMLGRMFYVTFIPVTVCECHTELKAT